MYLMMMRCHPEQDIDGHGIDVVAGRCQQQLQMGKGVTRSGSHRHCQSSSEMVTARLQTLQSQRQAFRCAFQEALMSAALHRHPDSYRY